MVDPFNVGASTIKEYVDIVCDVLIDKDNLFSKYINIPSCQHLKDIIAYFENLTCIPNICEAIDGIHILLVGLPSKRVTFASGDFFNRKEVPYYCVASCVMQTKSFGTFVLANLKGYMMVGSSRGVAYIYH
jgi:hypothetical protein